MTGESRWEARWLARSASARLAAAAGFGLLLAFTRNLTLPGTLLVILAGVLVWMVDPDAVVEDAHFEDAGLHGGETESVSGVVLWGIVVSAFVLWEAGAFFLGNNDAHPTFSMLSSPVLAWPPIRALAGFGWMSWGWRLRSR